MNNKKIIVVGEILFDVYPNYENLGGAPFNFSFHLNKLGHDIKFISSIGDDDRGSKIMQFLHKREFPVKYIQISKEYPTGVVNILLNDEGIPSYEIINEVAYDNITFDENLQKATIQDSDLLYFGTLAQRGLVSRETINKIIDNSSAKVKFYDINLRKGLYNNEVIYNSLFFCNFLKLNEDELEYVAKEFISENNIEKSIISLSKKFSIPTICLTKGAQGSVLFHNEQFFEKKTKTQQVIDTVGAGDAFSAMMVYGFLQNKEPLDILEVSSEFALKVCMLEGAIPIDDSWYDAVKFK
jgi:fructokinase